MFCWEQWYWHWNWFLPLKGCSAAIFFKAILGRRDLVSPSNHTPDQVEVDREGLTFDIQDIMVPLWFLGSDWAPRYVRIKFIGLTRIGYGTTRLGSKAQWARGSAPYINIYSHAYIRILFAKTF